MIARLIARLIARRNRKLRDRYEALRRLKQWLACRQLNRLVAKQRDSYECRRFRERRAAALKHTRPTQADFHAGAA